MTTLYAELGNTPALSLAELNALTGSRTSLTLPTLAKLETSLEGVAFGNLLGGTTKLISPLLTTTSPSLKDDLTHLIVSSSHKNVAVTNLSTVDLARADLHAIKSSVTESRPVRFLSLDTSGHSLVALRKQHIAEFVIFMDDSELKIGETVWIQDADDWTNRDRNKPYRDIKRGMLPPKVARIMANIACQGKDGLTFADPFCGTGTILGEAAMVGCTELFGSDTNPDAVSGSEKNLSWLLNSYNLSPTTYNLVIRDATHLDQTLAHVDAIATEPYMGPLLELDRLPAPDKLKNIAKGLTKLYLGSLRSWHRILAKEGRVVISVPSFTLGNRTISTLTVDDYARLGYNYISSVAYGKPGATVIRNITILEKAEKLKSF